MANLTSEKVNQANPIPKDLKSKLDSTQSKIESFAHRTEEKISDQAAQIAEQASHYVAASRQYVEENPVKSLAIAAATGLAAGGIVSVILRRKK